MVGLLFELFYEFLDIEWKALMGLTNGELVHGEGCSKGEDGVGELAVPQPGGE